MKSKPIRVWNKTEDPKESPFFHKRPSPPVTHEDLGGADVVLTAALREFDYEIVQMDAVPPDQERYSRANEALLQITEGRARMRIVNYKETIDLHTVKYDFGKAIAPRFELFFAENYKEVIDEIARRGLWIINVWGHEVFWTPPVPEEVVAYARQKLGDKFFGLDNGEHDCAFVIGHCHQIYPQPASHREAWENFMDLEFRIHNHIAHYPITLSNNTFQHYLADIPWTRMIGCQICESKPNIPMWIAILRGAAGQYGLKWWISPAEWNLWGAKAYRGESWGSAERGTSLSLLRRAWILSYMYGTSAIMGQYAFLMPDESLSPVGKVFMDAKQWIDAHPVRGVMHRPVALIWDFYAGYVTSRHAPLRDKPYMAWGNIP